MSGLQWILQNGDLEKLKNAVGNDPQCVNFNLSGGRKPLHYAADYGQLECMRYLVEMGADVNAADDHGISVLLAAIWEGHTKCVAYLLSKGAIRDGKTPDGSTYLQSADKQEIKDLLASI